MSGNYQRSTQQIFRSFMEKLRQASRGTSEFYFPRLVDYLMAQNVSASFFFGRLQVLSGSLMECIELVDIYQDNGTGRYVRLTCFCLLYNIGPGMSFRPHYDRITFLPHYYEPGVITHSTTKDSIYRSLTYLSPGCFSGYLLEEMEATSDVCIHLVY